MTKSKQRKSSFTFATIAWILTIGILSLLPSSSVPKVRILKSMPLDKIVHFGMYFILIILLLNVWRIYAWKINKIYLIIFCFCYGILMEYLQNFMKLGRSFDFYDILANLIGVLIGFLIYEKFLKTLTLWKSQ